MRGDEAERARLLEAEARIVRADALDHDGRLACFFGAAERVPDQPGPHTDALAVRPNRHRREIEDPRTGSAFNADPAQHHVSNHAGGVLGDQRQLRNELFRRPNALEEPGLVAEAVDLPVLRDASKSLGLATGVGVERRHQLVGRSGARKDLGIEVGELVGVLPRGRRSSDGDEARRLPR